MLPLLFIAFVVIAFFAFSWFRSVPQATVAVITVFGKYGRVMREGLNMKLPWETVFQRLSLQNRALQLEFQAITQDQANVKFATMVLYAVAAVKPLSVEQSSDSFLTEAGMYRRTARTQNAVVVTRLCDCGGRVSIVAQLPSASCRPAIPRA